jgi:hypothetical protein
MLDKNAPARFETCHGYQAFEQIEMLPSSPSFHNQSIIATAIAAR